VIALLCGVLGVGLGAIVAYAAQPHTSYSDDTHPMSALSPSVPIDEPTVRPPAPDIDFPALSPDLGLPPPELSIGNELATWTYHIPADWQAYAVCGAVGECPPPMATDDRLTARQLVEQPEVRFRPPGEPTVGGYSLRVKILDNTLALNPGQMVANKIVGFRQAYDDFRELHKTPPTVSSPSAVYFTYRDENDHLRYNFFQWFSAPGSSTATLEMSVAGRKRDVPGLKALFNRFADNVIGSTDPYRPPKQQKKQKQASASSSPSA